MLLERKNTLEFPKKVCENKHFCNIEMPSKETKIFNRYQKSDEAPTIIYADLESSIEKTGKCKDNPE